MKVRSSVRRICESCRIVRRKGSRRLVGHRQTLTVATVKAIA